jgi:Domain of unknown function (DUF4268)
MIAVVPLGHFDRVPLRDAWPTEDGHFTPWLAQPENLQLLAEALGLGELQDQQIEVRVGDFRINILAFDGESNAIIIENQLGQTDHDHLGQLLTYLAGQGRRASLIWIASRFRDEHRAVIDWLNRNTGDDFSFFGVELELWQISGSPPAPRFKLVAKPNPWIENVRAASREVGDPGLAERRRIRMAYWQSFGEFLRERNSAFAIRRPIRTAAYRFSMGQPGFWIVARISIREQFAEVGLAISRDPERARYHALLAERVAIEGKFGEPLTWDERPGTKRSFVSVARRGINLNDNSQYPNLEAWMLEKMERFRAVFADHIGALPVGSGQTEIEDGEV